MIHSSCKVCFEVLYYPDLSLEGQLKTANLRIVCISAVVRTAHALNKCGSGDASSIAD